MITTELIEIICPCCEKKIDIDSLLRDVTCRKCKHRILLTCPQPGPQANFLATDGIDIVVFGGGAGGGKTFGLCMEPMKHFEVPGFTCSIFRRTVPQLRQPGGLWATSREMWPQCGGETNEARLEWHFPSGAFVKMDHMEHDSNRFNHDGDQICLLMFDQLEHFSAHVFFYMLSRNRSTCGIKPYVRATVNPPDPNEEVGMWLHDLLGPWIKVDHPQAAKAGEVRWFTRDGENIKWVPEGTPDAKSITFIPASVYDNKILLEKDPGYIANLKALSFEDRQRLLESKWDIIRTGLMFKWDWFKDSFFDEPPAGIQQVIRVWDLAATEGGGAFTCGQKWGFKDGLFYLLDRKREQLSPSGVDQLMTTTVQEDGPYVAQYEEQEPGSGGKRQVELHKNTIFRGVEFHELPASQHGDKITRAKPLASKSEQGKIKIKRAWWNNELLSEWCLFPNSKYKDQVDPAAYAITILGGGYVPRVDGDTGVSFG